ncbi:hypothetical protein Tco_1354344 [Tanacetum coccineum]
MLVNSSNELWIAIGMAYNEGESCEYTVVKTSICSRANLGSLLLEMENQWSRFTTVFKLMNEFDKRDKDMQRILAILAKVFQKAYTNLPKQPAILLQTPGNRLRYQTRPRYNKGQSSGQFGKSKDLMTVAGTRETNARKLNSGLKNTRITEKDDDCAQQAEQGCSLQSAGKLIG